MLESLKHDGNLYLGWNMNNPDEVTELEKQMGMNPQRAERIQSAESQRLSDIEDAIAELAFGGEV